VHRAALREVHCVHKGGDAFYFFHFL
jgi:hypothetical protein